MEPLTLLAGAVILAVGLLVGHLSGRRTERRRQDRPQEPICGCTHHRARHDPKTNRCHARVYLGMIEGYGQCTCQQYTGPEPIQSVWVPPVAVEGGHR